ncbi:50S ribosomal protein L24 [Flavobacterium sp.]|uniref:50S ribosomal protein L24 n=1 Tax=Flavobacterium sp. TaxID=239 RepID=UPI0025BA04C7|nr:50S ribosomal protein L24 [Flavobacterium sp.]
MMKLKIKSGDLVRVIAGDHKGQEGKVLRVLRDKNKAIVEGVNMISKHTKPSAQNPQGGIVKKEAPIHISNIQIVDAKAKTTTKVGFKMEGDKKVRFSKKSNQVL